MPRISGIQVRNDTAANWTSINPTLLAGEIGYERDTAASKVGDGTTAWTALAYAVPATLAASMTALRTQVNALLAPTILTATGGSGQVTLIWSMLGAAASLATDYTIQYRTTAGPGAWTTFAHSASTALVQTVTGLTVGTSYDFRVASVTATTSAYSAIATGAPSVFLPNALYADSFNRANNTTGLGSTDGGSHAAVAWATAQSYYTISNATAVNTCVSGANNYAYLNAGQANGSHQVTIATAGSTSNQADAVGLSFRYYADNNHSRFYATWLPSTPCYVYFNSTLGATTISLAPAAGDVLKVVDNGSTVTCFVNGNSVLSVNTTYGNTYTNVGLYSASSNGHSASLKNWSYSTATS